MNKAAQVGQDRSISVKGSATGSVIITGDHNNTFQQAFLSELEIGDIQAELKALHEVLLRLKDPVVDGVVKKIDEEAKKPSPDKDTIGTALETGLNYAKNLQGFAEATDNLRPHVEKVAAWLGKNWYNILGLIT